MIQNYNNLNIKSIYNTIQHIQAAKRKNNSFFLYYENPEVNTHTHTHTHTLQKGSSSV